MANETGADPGVTYFIPRWVLLGLLWLGVAPMGSLAQSVIQSLDPLPGAYYTLGSGRQVHFSTPPGAYLLTAKPGATGDTAERTARVSTQLERQFGQSMRFSPDRRFTKKVRAEFLNPNASDQAKASVLNRLRNAKDVAYLSPVLVGRQGVELGLTTGVVLRVREGVDMDSALEALLRSENLLYEAAQSYASREFLFRFQGTVESPGAFFQAVRGAMALPQVEWAEPDFEVMPDRMFTPNDPRFADQWHLHNTGQHGGQVDADVDGPEGWDRARGASTVIAVVDDGFDMTHPDLPIWNNPGESGGGKETNGVDDDGNGYIDDYQGWDFGFNDNDPSPASASDNHGTAVAGIAGAAGDNIIGVSGSATNAKILPVRWAAEAGFCSTWAAMLRYAARYSDVVNNSWLIGGCESQLDAAITDAVDGFPAQARGFARRGDKGTPMLFASGNYGEGWEQVTQCCFGTGTYNFDWTYVKDGATSERQDTIFIDQIEWPDGSVSSFDTVDPDFTTSGDELWFYQSDSAYTRGNGGSSLRAGAIDNGKSSVLSVTKTFTSIADQTLTFWLWLSAAPGDGMLFAVGGTNYRSRTPSSSLQDGIVYPASSTDAIAIGAHDDGSASGSAERISYSQFSATLDVVAPSKANYQSVGIITTDRQGSEGYNDGSNQYNTADDAYTDLFNGTSAATPVASGVVANIMGIYPHMTADQLRQALQEGATQIGPVPYVAGRNDEYGHGAISLQGSLDWIAANSLAFDCDMGEAMIADRWMMMGLPCLADDPGSVASVLGDDLDGTKLSADLLLGEKNQTGTNNYSALTTSSAVTPGRGYWVKSTLGEASGGSFLDEGYLDVAGTETPVQAHANCPSANGCFVLALNSPAAGTSYEWNMVAHPFAYRVDWADVRFDVDGITYVPSAANNADYVNATYQTWSGSSYVPFDDATPGMEGLLAPNQGLWVQTLPGAIGKTVTMLIPATPSLLSELELEATPEGSSRPWYAQLSGFFIANVYADKPSDDQKTWAVGYEQREARRAVRKERLARGDDWYVRLSATNEARQLKDTGNVFGQIADSVTDYDSADLPERAPFSAPYLTVVFPHGNWGEQAGDYASDFHASARKDSWVFEVRTDDVNSPVELCWEGPEDVLLGSTLIDVDNKIRYSLKQLMKKKQANGRCVVLELSSSSHRFEWSYRQ